MKGQVYVLAEKGQANAAHLRQLTLSDKDLREDLRESGNVADLGQTETVYLKRDGSISVVKKQP